MARGLPQKVDTDELLSAGSFGLLSAVERFDPSRGNKLEPADVLPPHGHFVIARWEGEFEERPETT